MSRRRRCGMTLIEIMVAMAVLAVAAVGGLSLFYIIQTHNQSSADSRQAYKACQEVMELALAQGSSGKMTADGWMKQWNGAKFQAKKVHPTAYVGTVRVADISPSKSPRSLYEITVNIDSRGVTLKPLNVSIICRRSGL